MYPIGFPKYPSKVGIFLAGRQEDNQENQNTLSHLKFRVTLINQHNPRESIAAGEVQLTTIAQSEICKSCPENAQAIAMHLLTKHSFLCTVCAFLSA